MSDLGLGRMEPRDPEKPDRPKPPLQLVGPPKPVHDRLKQWFRMKLEGLFTRGLDWLEDKAEDEIDDRI